MLQVRRTGPAAALTLALALAVAAPTGLPEASATGARCETNPDVPKRQLRADWIATVANIDWPSRPGLTPAQQRAELTALYDQAKGRRLNAVVLQVRPTADAFWPSPYEPWSKYLTGTQGRHPGYNPLAFAVAQAHRRNLEFHAWFNPYRVSMDTNRRALDPSHPARIHPNWVRAYGGKLYYDPGIPAVRRLTVHAIMHAVRHYDIDAVHFDDYFYPYPVPGQAFPDKKTFATYPDGYTNRARWRRHNTNLLITTLDRRIHAAKPWVKLGVSPFAVWRNKSTDPRGSATSAGVQTFDDLYADTRKWVRQEWLDYIAPQVYWSIGFAPADYAVLVPWWSRTVARTNVRLYVGQATYKVGTSTQSPEWDVPREMSRHLFFNRRFSRVDGDIYFSAKDVRANRLGHMDLVQSSHYRRPALVPASRGVRGSAPDAPSRLLAERVQNGVKISWVGPGTSYAVYRFVRPHRRVTACDFADASHLVGTVNRNEQRSRQSWTDKKAAPGRHYTYFVTGLDRTYRESARSQRTRS